MRLRARHYRTGQHLDIVCERGIIESMTPAASSNGPTDLSAVWVAPAFFDLQINGCLGKAFVSPQLTIDDVRVVVRTCQAHGISGLCPTLITAGTEALQHGFTVLRQACEADGALSRAMPCFHLEGPYISPEDGPRGAHPRAHVRPPDLEEFHRLQDAAGGRIRLVTLAPEHDGALPFIEALSKQGIVVALGHTGARPARIREAIRAGARLSTHLGNGSHALLPRHENYLWEQLAADDLWASIITDGHHLPEAVVRCVVRIKSPARLIITCDASSLAGSPPGLYNEWGQDIEVKKDGSVVVPGTSFLAGSGMFTDACVRMILGTAEVSLTEAIDMAGARPRQLLGLPDLRLETGQPADLVLFDHGPNEPFAIRATVINGEVVAGASPGPLVGV
jgi:N-acetylglucosamine-6-phosphate deacetylase